MTTTPPATPPTTPPASPPAAYLPPPPPRGSGWTTGRVVSVVAGTLAALLALGLTLAGVGLLVADHAARDANGYLTTPRVFVGSSGYAITTEQLGMHGDMMGGGPGSGMPHAMLGDVQVTAVARGGRDVFVGIAPTVEVARYLGGVSRCVLRDVQDSRAVCDEITGGQLSVPPTAAGIWVQQSTGGGRQTLTWSPENGDWTVVVMNADGSPAVAADVSVGAQVPALAWVVTGLLVGAGLSALAAVFLVVVPVRRARRTNAFA